MKISEMTNDQAAEALIRLSVPFGNICDDEKIMSMVDKYQQNKDIPFIRLIGRMLPELVGYALKEHKNDMYEIIGVLSFKTSKEVAKMKFVDTIKVVQESYDEVLQGFFTSSAKRIKETAEESSAS